MPSQKELPVGLRNKAGRNTILRSLLNQKKVLVAPGAFTVSRQD